MNSPALRDVFWNRIYEKAQEDRNVILVSADMGAPSLDKFRRDLPEQFVNVGIAEQNGLLIAAGLAMEGKHTFLYGIAPFVTLRCLEQIRVENSMMKIPVTIVGVGTGFGYDDSGPTHHQIEDIAVMRALPNVTIYTATDSIMTHAIVDETCCADHAHYVRLDRAVMPVIYSAGTNFSEGFNVIQEGCDGCIISMGYMVHVACALAERMQKKGIDLTVIDLFRIPANEKGLVAYLQDMPQVITLEEHFLPGGLGSYVLESLNDAEVLKPVKRIGLTFDKGYCFAYGGRTYIHEFYDLDEASVECMIMDVLQQK